MKEPIEVPLLRKGTPDALYRVNCTVMIRVISFKPFLFYLFNTCPQSADEQLYR